MIISRRALQERCHPDDRGAVCLNDMGSSIAPQFHESVATLLDITARKAKALR